MFVDFNREQAKAKQCLNKLIASDFDFTPAIQEITIPSVQTIEILERPEKTSVKV